MENKKKDSKVNPQIQEAADKIKEQAKKEEPLTRALSFRQKARLTILYTDLLGKICKPCILAYQNTVSIKDPSERNKAFVGKLCPTCKAYYDKKILPVLRKYSK